jgi:hypothetical protein
MACDPTAMFKTADDLAKGALGALKSFDPKVLAGADPKALLAKIPANMIPAGVNMKGLDMAALMKNPAALAKMPGAAKFAGLLG